MLTDIEKGRLATRDTIDSKIKARNEFIIRNKLNKWFSDSDDALFVLKNMDNKSLRRILSEEIVSTMYILTEKVTALFPFELMIRFQNGPFICRYVPDPNSPYFIGDPTNPLPMWYRREEIRKATGEEIKKRKRFESHIHNLLSVLPSLELKPLLIEIIAKRFGSSKIKNLARELIHDYVNIEDTEKLIKDLQYDLEKRRNLPTALWEKQWWEQPWRY